MALKGGGTVLPRDGAARQEGCVRSRRQSRRAARGHVAVPPVPELGVEQGMGWLLGADLGSVSVKVVVVDMDGRPIFEGYQRHQARVRAVLAEMLEDARHAVGDRVVGAAVSGSAGAGVWAAAGVPYVQEVVSAADLMQRLFPDVRTLLDIGGEDAKLVHLGSDGRADLRMNGACAGGTGAYLDEMARLLDVTVEQLGALAEHAETRHSIASRCGVFGKTDVQSLLSQRVPRADIAGSVLAALALQVVASLAKGLTFEPKVLFSGGPLTFMPALRSLLLGQMGLSRDDLVIPRRPELLVATGAALAAAGVSPKCLLSELQAALRNTGAPSTPSSPGPPPLFADHQCRDDWISAQARQTSPPPNALPAAAKGACFLGLDSGSTTTKLVLLDEAAQIAFTHYENNHGDPLAAAQRSLDALRDACTAAHCEPSIAHGTATGYGEDLVRAAFGLQSGLVETLAHFRAARSVDPDVSFLLDIGGQDMKAVFARNGQIDRIEINEACSAGCGTFLESLAGSLGYSVSDFAELACESQAPYDLGSRCTVFMNSRIKQALRDGAAVADIAAGLACAVVQNALHKVLRIADVSVLGEHIVVAGGTLRNPAVRRALELLLGRAVTCPECPELMGAHGAALHARDTWVAGAAGAECPVPLGLPDARTRCRTRSLECGGCANRCNVRRTSFENTGTCHTGNRCERVYSSGKGHPTRGRSLDAERQALLFDRPLQPAGMPTAVIGIPRALNAYEDFPFWCTLLVESGFEVRLSGASSDALYTKGAPTVMTESLCFPAKMVHGHVLDLVSQRVDRVLYPMVPALDQEFPGAVNAYNCPIVTGYADVIRSAIEPLEQHGVPLDAPTVSFTDASLLRHACERYVLGLGVERRRFARAFEAATKAQSAYRTGLRSAGTALWSHATASGAPVVLLLGRPYHRDPLINHGVTAALVDLGVHVIDEDAVPRRQGHDLPVAGSLTQWAHTNNYFDAVTWACSHRNVSVVQLNSFGCGPDAFTQPALRRILEEHGKTLTVIRVDEVAGTGGAKLRLRSMVEAMTASSEPRPKRPARDRPLFLPSDRAKRIIIPSFSHLCAPIVAGPVLSLGYQLETLPPTDTESLAIGLRYVPHEVCYPAVAVVGDVVRALQSGRYDPSEVVVGSWQTGGQCRASNYLSLLAQALEDSGFGQVPIVALTPNRRLHPQPGYNLNLRRYLPRVLLAAIYGDAVASMYYAIATRADDRVQARALADELLEPLRQGKMDLRRDAVMARLADAVNGFDRLPAHDRPLPTVGLVGEIFVKHNAFANRDVCEWLMDQDIEVVAPQFLTLFLSTFVNTDVRVRSGLARRNLAWLAASAFEGYVQSVWHQAEELLGGFRLHRRRHDIRSLAAEASRSVSLAHAYGECWLTAGEIGLMARDGVADVLCLQPFGCIASQVVAQGIARRLRRRYSGTTVTYLDIDVAASDANYFNRLALLASQAKRRYRSLEGKGHNDNGTSARHLHHVMA